jgi:drug/metabolite transporter superfamily protein YnfA
MDAVNGRPHMKQRLAIFAAATALVALALPGIVAAADAQVVAGKVIGAHGTLLVATNDQMTLYTELPAANGQI